MGEFVGGAAGDTACISDELRPHPFLSPDRPLLAYAHGECVQEEWGVVEKEWGRAPQVIAVYSMHTVFIKRIIAT